jgi:8-oxo-dGTP pyrophosphatase MutT (NUDIX family)
MTSSPPDVMRRVLSQRESQTVADHSLISAAVFLLLYPKGDQYCVLFNKRSQEVEYHKGEISVPGGARDPEDLDYLDTALRETEEEMGIVRADVTVLGELDEIKTRSGFRVKVFVGTIPEAYPFEPSAAEIAEVLEVPIANLRDVTNRRVETRWGEDSTVTRYSYAYGKHLIFGATARIVQQFLELLGEAPEVTEH